MKHFTYHQPEYKDNIEIYLSNGGAWPNFIKVGYSAPTIRTIKECFKKEKPDFIINSLFEFKNGKIVNDHKKGVIVHFPEIGHALITKENLLAILDDSEVKNGKLEDLILFIGNYNSFFFLPKNGKFAKTILEARQKRNESNIIHDLIVGNIYSDSDLDDDDIRKMIYLGAYNHLEAFGSNLKIKKSKLFLTLDLKPYNFSNWSTSVVKPKRDLGPHLTEKECKDLILKFKAQSTDLYLPASLTEGKDIKIKETFLGKEFKYYNLILTKASDGIGFFQPKNNSNTHSNVKVILTKDCEL